MRGIYGFLQLVSRLVNLFGHPSQVRMQVLVNLQTCIDLQVFLARALDCLKLFSYFINVKKKANA